MISNQTLPLLWKYREKWFSGEQRVILDVGGNKMAVRPRSYDLYVLGEVFGEEVYAPRSKQIPAPDVVLDLGANIGAFSVWAARRWNPAKILAVEMEQANFALLEENIRLNALSGHVIPVKVAVWDENGWVGIRRNNFNHGKHQVSPDCGEDGVRAVTLGELMNAAEVKRADFLKMDIEGSEARLFNEANEGLLAQGVRYMTVEVHPTKGVLVEKIAGYLERIGFEVNVRRQWLRTTAILEAANKRF